MRDRVLFLMFAFIGYLGGLVFLALVGLLRDYWKRGWLARIFCGIPVLVIGYFIAVSSWETLFGLKQGTELLLFRGGLAGFFVASIYYFIVLLRMQYRGNKD